jgi:hypothetical protein
VFLISPECEVRILKKRRRVHQIEKKDPLMAKIMPISGKSCL